MNVCVRTSCTRGWALGVRGTGTLVGIGVGALVGKLVGETETVGRVEVVGAGVG